MKIPIFKLFTVMRFIHQKYFYVCLLLMGLAVCTLAFVRLSGAADFACQSGDESCLLRAIEAANANGEANTIALEVGTYTLEAAVPDEDTTMGPTGLPAVTGVVTIQGRGGGVTNIMRSSSDDFRLVYVGATGVLTLDGLTLSGGRNPGGAAGILNNGTLLITSSTLANNLQLEVRGGAGAGGLRNMGTAILANSLVTGNVAQFGTSGIENFGMLVLTKTTLADNAHSGPTHLTDAGGLFNSGSGKATLTDCSLFGNQGVRGGGILNGGSLTLVNCTVAGNQALENGGGISNSGSLTLINSTVAFNTATAGDLVVLMAGAASKVVVQTR